MISMICRIPLTAVFTVQEGKSTMTHAEETEIPADAIAQFLIEKCGQVKVFDGNLNQPSQKREAARVQRTPERLADNSLPSSFSASIIREDYRKCK